MAARYPDIPQTVDPSETHYYFFDHLIACVKSGRGPGELCCPHAIAIDPNSKRIYVAEGIYFKELDSVTIARVSIFSETGEFLNMFSHPDMKEPWGIAIHEDNVYVTDTEDHCILHFKVEADFHLVTKLGSRGSGIGQFHEPRQLAVSNNGDVFVIDRGNNRVQILDNGLHYQRHISHHSLTHLSDVKLTQDEVYILCQTSPRVKVFSYTGDLIRSLITQGFGIQVDSSSFLCLDINLNLLISEYLNHEIKIFSKEGALLYTLGGYYGEVAMFVNPNGIALTNNQNLIVVCQDWRCLKILSYN